MDERLRRACPCLEKLWQRIFGDKKSSPAAGAAGRTGADNAAYNDDVEAQSPVLTPPQAEEKLSESGAIYTAVWSFEARHQDELSFQEGDIFSVFDRNGDWCTAQKIDNNGRVLDTGIVPIYYLSKAESLRTQPWFFGFMSRFEAQRQLLGAENEDGSFLIRQSEKDNCGYVLSVRSSNLVKHFKILQSASGNYYVEPYRQFSSLVDLVAHYCNNTLINTGRLSSHCKRKKPNTSDLNHFTVDQWELPKEEFTLQEELGRGYFADVYKGRWKNHISVAIKILKNDSELDHSEFHREVQILKNLRHRHLIKLYAVCTNSVPYYIVTELMEKGSLLEFLRGTEGQQLDTASLVDMAAQVADGMSYLEEQKSIHRDLAARNVLVSGDYICKVADFGLARVIKDPFYISAAQNIPYKWTSPEAISHGMYSIMSDVWSFGILLFEIITYGGIPYPALSNMEVWEQVEQGYRMPAPASCPEKLYQIMLQCWSANPDDRPHFKTLKVKLDSEMA